MWTFSIFLEAVAIFPQLVMLQRYRNIDNLTGNYVFLLGYVSQVYVIFTIFMFGLKIVKPVLLSQKVMFHLDQKVFLISLFPIIGDSLLFILKKGTWYEYMLQHMTLEDLLSFLSVAHLLFLFVFLKKKLYIVQYNVSFNFKQWWRLYLYHALKCCFTSQILNMQCVYSILD